MVLDNAGAHLRTLQISTALTYCLFSVGICFGFAALKPILVASGVYERLCLETSHSEWISKCVKQEIALNNLFTWAAVGTNVTAFPIGLLLDKYGPRTTSIIGAILIFCGSLGMSCSSSAFELYIPSYAIMATGGAFLLLSSFSLASLVPSKAGLIVSGMTGAFDASSGLFLIYRLAYQATHKPSIKLFFGVYCVVPVAILIAQLWYMPRRVADDDKAFSIEPTNSSHEAHSGPCAESTETTALLQNSEDSGVFDASKVVADPVNGVMHSASTLEILTSGWFLLPALVMITSLIRVNFYIATVNSQLKFLLHADDAEIAMNIFDILLPVGGILAIPLIGWVLDTYTTPTVYLLTFLLSLTSGILSFVPNAYVQTAHIFTFVVLRPWDYSILPGTVTKLFGNERFGAFYGLIMGVAGLVNLLSHNLEVLTWERYSGSFYPVDAGLVTASCLALVSTVFYMFIKVRKMET